MHEYKAFYKGKTCTVITVSILKAREEASAFFKASNMADVRVVLIKSNIS